MAMTTFKMPKAEKGKASGSLPTHDDTKTPPTMYLEHHHLDQLGMKKMPSVGSKLKFNVVAHVGSTSEDQDRPMDGGGPRRSMRLHIHQMEMGTGEQSTGAPDEDQEEQSKAGAKAAMDKALKTARGSESSKAKPAGGKKGQQDG